MTVDLGTNPHGLLGAHEAEDGVVVRAYRPEAQAVRVQPANYKTGSVEAKLKDPSGLWEALLPGGETAVENMLFVYELEKAIYELRYELDNRPDWVSIPAAGIRRLLESA